MMNNFGNKTRSGCRMNYCLGNARTRNSKQTRAAANCPPICHEQINIIVGLNVVIT